MRKLNSRLVIRSTFSKKTTLRSVDGMPKCRACPASCLGEHRAKTTASVMLSASHFALSECLDVIITRGTGRCLYNVPKGQNGNVPFGRHFAGLGT